MTRGFRLLLLVAFVAYAAHAQFALFRVNGGVETAVQTVSDFGSVSAGDTASAQFRVRSVSSAPAVLSVLHVAGSGFTLTGPTLPVTVAPSASVDFSVAFLSNIAGTYSAALDITGLSVLLTATVTPSLTYTVALPAGPQPLGSTAVDFGQVAVGKTAALNFTAANRTSTPLVVPALAVQGGSFALSGTSPAGAVLHPQQQAAFAVRFAPLSAGISTGALVIGSRSYALTGTALQPIVPQPLLSINLPQAQSGQQGTLAVNLDVAATDAGSGTVTLQFQSAVPGATDPAIAFSNGAPTVSFTYSPGDTVAHFGDQTTVPFQTGTTAGTLVFTATLGAATAQQTVPVPAAAIGLTNIQASRASGSVTVQITGFDNTRSAGLATFTFFDASGNPIAPGGITTNNLQDFSSYFSNSGMGGVFLLTAVFPVAGDTSQIISVAVQMVNALVATKSDPVHF